MACLGSVALSVALVLLTPPWAGLRAPSQSQSSPPVSGPPAGLQEPLTDVGTVCPSPSTEETVSATV